jgi:outer membrane protein TolC
MSNYSTIFVNNFKYKLLVMLILCNSLLLFAQKKDINLSLKQVIDLSLKQSPMAKLAATSFKNKYWIYKTYKADYKPQLRLNATLPELTRSYQNVAQNDGSFAFRLRSASTSSVNLNLSQNVGLTGGQFFVGSSLDRLDIFGTSNSVSYLSSPFLIGFNQPVFGFNNLKWQNKIEPLRYEESQKAFNEDMENVAIRASELYFNLLMAQNMMEIQQKNLANNDTLYKIAVGRYNLGKIAENELLQMELSVMNAKTNLAQAQLDVELRQLELKTFLKFKGDENIILENPNVLPLFEVNENKALDEAIKNRQQMVSFKRQILEAESEVARARGERLNININASYGLTQSSAIIQDVYSKPLEQQRLRFGIDIPIVDWGRANARIQTAVANKELVETQMEQAEQNFKQEVYLSVKQLNMYRQKLLIALTADSITQKRYDITIKRYLIGKIGIIDLNMAIIDKNQTKQDYIAALGTYWNAYFELRRKTLYDFELNKPIVYAKDR